MTMEATYFLQYRGVSGSMDFLAAGLLLLAVLLGIALIIERPKHSPMVHSPRMAWIRAGLYFCAVGLFAWLSGVLPAIASQPLYTAAQLQDPVWIGLAVLCVALFAWGYLYWWPRGTLTHGRQRYLLASGLFGLAWGACGGLFLLSIYAVIEGFGLPVPAIAVVTLVIVAIYNINYQSGWWDIHVSPPHNIRDWNNKKVLGAHNPFLLATLTWFVLYGNAGLFVLLYACAISASAIAMRFPPFWEADGPAVSYDTAIGE